jgi:hypothetical protein
MVFDLAVELIEDRTGVCGGWSARARIPDGLKQRLAQRRPIAPEDGIQIA